MSKMPGRPPRIRGEAGLLTSAGNTDLHIHASGDGFCQTIQATSQENVILRDFAHLIVHPVLFFKPTEVELQLLRTVSVS